MSLRIPGGFRLKTNDIDLFKKEISSVIQPILMMELSKELYRESFNEYLLGKEKDINNILIDKYQYTLNGLEDVINKGLRNFSIIDVLCSIILLKKDNTIYGLIDCDIPFAKDTFLQHSLVEHYSPNYYHTEEEYEEKKSVWDSLLDSLMYKKDFYLETWWLWKEYPQLNEVIEFMKSIFLEDKKLENKLLTEYILDKICVQKNIKKYSEVLDILEEITENKSKGDLSLFYNEYVTDFEKVYAKYKEFYI